MTSRVFLFLFYLMMASGLHAQETGFALVELFTSESCASCPAGDKIQSALSQEAEQSKKNIFCLEYHVDYWNKGGWKDPYSKNQFTFRQENYSRVLPGNEMYTPQLVFNGQTEMNANQLESAKVAVNKALSNPAILSVSLNLDSVRRDTAFVSYTCSKQDKNFILRIAFSENRVSSKVTGGLHAGKTLEHDNVVRILFSVDNPKKSGSAGIPLKGFLPGKLFSWTAFVQHKQSMKILGAVRLK